MKTVKDVEEWLKGKTAQQFLVEMSALTGWTAALISRGKGSFRIQFQSNPPQDEDAGEIKCVTGKDIFDCVLKSLKTFKKRKR